MADPTPLDLTQPWWEQHQGRGFVLPRCDSCQRFHFYPQAACPHCGHAICQAAPASGRGEVYTFSIVHRAPSPAFAADVPYAVVVVKTDEGPHLMARLLQVDMARIHIGQRVKVAWGLLPSHPHGPAFIPEEAA
jgi:uncharacterized OB-fold protein